MSKGYLALTVLFSCLFSASITVGRRITFGGNVMLKNSETYIENLTPTDAVVFLIVAAVLEVMVLLIGRYVLPVLKNRNENKKSSRVIRFAAIMAAVILLVWLPHILTVAPGNVYIDSLESINQMLKHGHPTSSHHPIFYTLMLGVFMKIGTLAFGSVNIGIFLASIFQTLVLLACIVLVLAMLYRKGVNRILIAAAAAYFMFMPYFPNYGMSLWKDVLFSCMLLLLSMLLYALIEQEMSKKLWMLCYMVIGVGCMAFRNNGLYVFAGTSVLCAVLLRRYAKQLLLSAAAAMVIFCSLTSLATWAWNIHGDFVENLGIPLQQLGYTINNEGDFSEEDRAYLYELMPEQVWNYAYRPCLVDPIKWNPQFNKDMLLETKGQFFSVWFRGLMRNPGKYIQAYLLATHGFWKPGVQNLYGYMDVQMNENSYGIGFMDLFEKLFGFSIMPILMDYPIIMGSGTLLWLVLLGTTLACMYGSRNVAPYLPALLNWATVMIATPVAFSLRYVYVFALGLPFYLGLPLLISRGKTARIP